jgi:membrane protein YqaA with SNARE-associated domain
MFKSIYQWVIKLSRHRLAPWFLALISFAESTCFPIPPDVMMIPMALAKPKKAFHYALITTLTSVTGGMVGYFIGFWAVEWVEPLLKDLGYWGVYIKGRELFDAWGFYAVLLAGFSPIPYKIFTISAGALKMFFPYFLISSIIGRGGRFFLVAALLYWGGEGMEQMVEKQIERIGWGSVVFVVFAGVTYGVYCLIVGG